MEAALNVACAGGEPLALTDCLNFGNPEKPEIGWELAQAIEGIAQAARRARHPRRLRQRLALQRDRRRADPADARRRLRRARPRRDAHPRRAGSRGDRVCPPARRGRRARRASSGENAHRFSLAHDVSDGGARARAARGRGVVADATRDESIACSKAPASSSRRAGAGCRGTTSSSSGRSPDVRRLRHPRAGPRRRAAHVLRPLRAAAPRPGVGGDRRLRERPPDRAARPRPRDAGVRRAHALGPARRARDRAHALLDDGRERVGERAAAPPPRPRAHRRARAQRQPRQRRGAARRASASRSRRPPTAR